MGTPTIDPRPEAQEGHPAYEDPIVAEVHRIREEIFAEFGYDIDRLHEETRKAQLAHPERIVSFINEPCEEP